MISPEHADKLISFSSQYENVFFCVCKVIGPISDSKKIDVPSEKYIQVGPSKKTKITYIIIYNHTYDVSLMQEVTEMLYNTLIIKDLDITLQSDQGNIKITFPTEINKDSFIKVIKKSIKKHSKLSNLFKKKASQEILNLPKKAPETNQQNEEAIEDLQNQLESKTKEIEILLDQLKKKTEEISELTQKSDEQQSIINELENKIEQLNKKSQTSNKIEILDANEIIQLKKIKELGQGSFAKTFLVSKMVEQNYVLKQLIRNNYKSFQNFLCEYEILNHLNHPNILKTYGIFFSNEEIPPSILLELCDIDMEKAIRKKALSYVDIIFSIYQIAEGMKYVHFKKIIHRDLKPANILWNKNRIIKICDFGVAKLLSNDELTTLTEGIGTLLYMAPEILDNKNYDEKVDVFSFGVMMFFLLNEGDVPGSKILRGQRLTYPLSFTEFAVELIESCLDSDPEKRPSFCEICNKLNDHNYKLLEISNEENIEIQSCIIQYKKEIPNY